MARPRRRQKFSPGHEMIVIDSMDWTSSSRAKDRSAEGDITRVAVDAMSNAANSALAGGGGVDGAIHRAGGPAIMRELDAFARGSALPHRQRGGDRRRRLAGEVRVPRGGPGVSRWHATASRSCWPRATASALELAEERAVRTISFPAISTGIYGYPLKEAAEIAMREVKASPGADGGRSGDRDLRAVRQGGVRGLRGVA